MLLSKTYRYPGILPLGVLETKEFKKWWNLENNLEDCDLSTYDEEAAFKKTAELLY